MKLLRERGVERGGSHRSRLPRKRSFSSSRKGCPGWGEGRKRSTFGGVKFAGGKRRRGDPAASMDLERKEGGLYEHRRKGEKDYSRAATEQGKGS